MNGRLFKLTVRLAALRVPGETIASHRKRQHIQHAQVALVSQRTLRQRLVQLPAARARHEIRHRHVALGHGDEQEEAQLVHLVVIGGREQAQADQRQILDRIEHARRVRDEAARSARLAAVQQHIVAGDPEPRPGHQQDDRLPDEALRLVVADGRRNRGQQIAYVAVRVGGALKVVHDRPQHAEDEGEQRAGHGADGKVLEGHVQPTLVVKMWLFADTNVAIVRLLEALILRQHCGAARMRKGAPVTRWKVEQLLHSG